MRNFLKLVGRFGADERGVFGVIFAVMAIVIVAFGGAVVDYVSVQQAKTRAQVALDAAALALQPQIYTQTQEMVRLQAEKLLLERLSNSGITARVTSATFDLTNGSLDLQGWVQVNTNFVRLVGVNSLTAGVLSEATRKKLNLEVALVLDNSGSMADNQNNNAKRLSRLKEAARCATDILLSGNDNCPSTASGASGTTTVKDTWIGVVPFNAFVNVGPTYANATWMDTKGLSRIARDNFDNDDNPNTPFTGPVNRFALYDSLKGVTWAGCVEARSHNGDYDVTDKPPSQAVPDSLFVPVFAPSEPSSWTGSSANNYIPDSPPACTQTATCTYTRVKTNCATAGNNKSNFDKSCNGSVTDTWIYKSATGASKSVSACPTQDAGNPAVTSDSYSYTGPKNGPYENTWRQSYSYPFSDRVLQERLCKYTGATVDTSKAGPNGTCGPIPLLPLTDSKSAIINKINSMVAAGNTNIAQGAVWGWHMLSDNEPLTQALPYNSGANSKVMVLMTDGDNTSNYNANNMNLSTLYSAYGFPWNDKPSGAPANSRLWGPPGNSTTNGTALPAEINVRTRATCKNAKDAGIKIYTIGLSSTNAETIQMLKDCSSGDGYWYFPATSDALKDTFKQIASQLASLRLAK